MRFLYGILAATLTNFTVGVWNISLAFGDDLRISNLMAGVFSIFAAGYCAMTAWQHYQFINRPRMEPPDSGVNWRRDGF